MVSARSGRASCRIPADISERTMSEEKQNNCKCPLCGNEFYLKTDELQIVCPSCGETVSRPQAEKYYSSMHVMKTALKEAHGEDYHRVRMLIDAAYDLLRAQEYASAEEKVKEALDITESDYRVYMAMVAVRTKNYTDLSDLTHKEYLNRAIACADPDGKKEITSLYKNYYMKTKLTDEELGRLANEEKKSSKKRVEEDLKRMIPDYMTKEKRNKVFLILFPLLLAVGVAMVAVGLVTEISWLSLAALAFVLAGYLLLRSWFVNKDLVKAFNNILDVYDLIDGLSLPDDRASAIYGDMKSLADRFADVDPFVSMGSSFMRLTADLLDAHDGKIDEYLSESRFWNQFLPREEEA